MKHKATKISLGFTLLVCAMVSLVGVAFAVAYQGSATTPVDNTSSEFITVAFDGDKEGIFATTTPIGTKIYTVDTKNDGTNVTLLNLKVGDSVAQPYTDKYFVYSEGKFSLSDSEGAYKSSIAGKVPLEVTLSTGATANTYSMSIFNLNAPITNENGMSLVYTYKIGTGAETVFNPSSPPAISLTAGTPVDVVFSAYVVYKTSVPVANMSGILPFSVNGNAEVSFTFSASVS